MARNKELSPETRQSILDLRNEGFPMREIAKKLKISYNAVYYSINRTEQTGSTQNRNRSGRPRCTTEQEDKYIRASSLKNRHLTGPQLAASLNSTRKTAVSTSTVKRRLRDAGHMLSKRRNQVSDCPIKRKEGDEQNNKSTRQRRVGKKCYGQASLNLRCSDQKEEQS